MTLTREELKKTYLKIQVYRGFIIGKSIDIESMINAILNLYFAKKSRQNEFMHKALDDEYFSFGLKIRILEKINLNLEKELIKKIRRINNIRNEFAHKVPGIIPKSDTISISFDITKKDPKKIEDLHRNFVTLVKETEQELNKIFDQLVNENNK
jgi:hypothetical protein